jgi:tetratricopeptide (TPR) repeat protein
MGPPEGAGTVDPDAQTTPATGEALGTIEGTRIGRYRLGARLGAGGMGTVHVARDLELARDVALKILRVDDAGRDDLAAMRSRLQREAQAMARLSHPNVVPVFDIGAVGTRLFIAMELVHGQSLRTWMATPRRWRSIVRVFVAAGRGLAAAHDVGLVHRDFKPDNVVGADRTPRVTDFGLARELERRAVPAADTPAELPTSDDALARLTASGGFAGTPAYMAPEQLVGRDEIGAAADQFAFCVSLFEAVYGVVPFERADAGTAAHLAAILARRIAAVPADRRAPRWLHAAIIRGLATDPHARWPSMTSLVDALERGLGRTRRAVIGIGALAVVGAVTAMVATRGAELETCPDPAKPLAGVWDVARRDRLAARFGAEPRWPTTLGMIERYTTSLTLARGSACSARVAGRLSTQAEALAQTCLDRAQAELARRLDGIEARRDDTLVGAVKLLSRGHKLAICDDPLLLAQMQPRPDQQAAVDALAPDVARLGDVVGKRPTPEAFALADAVIQRARTIGHPQQLAYALMLQGRLHAAKPEDAIRIQSEAVAIADANGLWPTAHDARIALLDQYERQGHYADALAIADVALASARSHGDVKGAAGAATSRANLLAALARTDEALAAHQTAIELASQVDDSSRLRAESNLARTLSDLGRHAEAVPHHRIALRLMRIEAGPDDANLGSTMFNLAWSELEQYAAPTPAQLARARDTATEARAILERAGNPGVSAVDNFLGTIAKRSGDLAAALTVFERAAAHARASDDAVTEVSALTNVADVLRAQGRGKDAIAALDRAVARLAATQGNGDTPDSIELLLIRSAVELELLRDAARSLRTAVRADAIARAVKSDEWRAMIDHRHAIAQLQLGAFREGLARAQACQIRYRRDGDRVSEAKCAVLVSHGRWDAERDGAGAQAALDEAILAADAGHVATDDPLRAEIATWGASLATRRRSPASR